MKWKDYIYDYYLLYHHYKKYNKNIYYLNTNNELLKNKNNRDLETESDRNLIL